MRMKMLLLIMYVQLIWHRAEHPDSCTGVLPQQMLYVVIAHHPPDVSFRGTFNHKIVDFHNVHPPIWGTGILGVDGILWAKIRIFGVT